jgi:hypothetical protein
VFAWRHGPFRLDALSRELGCGRIGTVPNQLDT